LCFCQNFLRKSRVLLKFLTESFDPCKKIHIKIIYEFIKKKFPFIPKRKSIQNYKVSNLLGKKFITRNCVQLSEIGVFVSKICGTSFTFSQNILRFFQILSQKSFTVYVVLLSFTVPTLIYHANAGKKYWAKKIYKIAIHMNIFN